MEASLSTDPSGHTYIPVAAPTSGSRLDPLQVCDLLLDAALGNEIDTIWFEPRAPSEEHYDVALERQGVVMAVGTLDANLGAAVIARLAMLADIDLMLRRPSTGRTFVRSASNAAEIVVTVRPGRSLRAEVFVRRQGARPVVATAPVDLEPGTMVGHYRVRWHVGSGGMGRVYQVEHATLGRAYALKVLHAHARTEDPESNARFVREARAAARIKHPSVVDVFDFGYLADGRPYLVMELLPGASLTDLMANGPLEPRVGVAIAKQLASALAAAHDVGVIHADVSPSNVLVGGDHAAKLVDFGLALLRDDTTRLATDEAGEYVLGTPSYISPEQIRGQVADERSDQYALGAVIYEMLVGKPPFAGRSLRDLCLKHIGAPVPALVSPFGPLPVELTRTVERCLAKTADLRFGSMHEVAAALVEAEQAVFVRGWRRWLST